MSNELDYERGGTQKAFYSAEEVVSAACPLCRSAKSGTIYKERGSLGIVKCAECGLIYVSPRLKNPQEVYWGDAGKYFEEAKFIFEGKATHHRDSNYEEDIRLIRRYKPRGRFLDIGTNMGFFLRKAKGLGWNLYGVEPSGALSEMARKYFGLNVKTCFLKDAGFEADFFDVVTMTDVFEHICDPQDMLKDIRYVLKPDGILFIKVPNGLFNLFKFYAARVLRRLRDYDIFDSYEHVVHYTHRTLALMLERNGFIVLRTKIARPIQLPVWHKYVGHFYQYPSPLCLDLRRRAGRNIFYYFSLIEYILRLGMVGYLAPNITVIAKKA